MDGPLSTIRLVTRLGHVRAKGERRKAPLELPTVVSAMPVIKAMVLSGFKILFHSSAGHATTLTTVMGVTIVKAHYYKSPLL